MTGYDDEDDEPHVCVHDWRLNGTCVYCFARRRPIMRTWVLEAWTVTTVLAVVTATTGGGWRQWLSAAAVLFTFMHAQVSDRLVGAEHRRAIKAVACYRWAARYYMAKELTWAAWFVATGSWAALVGCAVFLAYPFWRSYHVGGRTA